MSDEQAREHVLSCLADVKLYLEELKQHSSAVATARQWSMDDGLPVVAGRLDCTLKDLERRARVHLRDEQGKPNPDNALIATLCDTVRCVREYVERMSGPIYVPPSREDSGA